MTQKKKETVNACTLCNGNCLGCFYCDECGVWLDDETIPIPQIETNSKEEVQE